MFGTKFIIIKYQVLELLKSMHSQIFQVKDKISIT